MVFPATLSLLTGVFTERRARAAAIGLWGASAGVGVALGPIAGGWLLEWFWWGSIFVFMVPVAALVAVLAAWRVPPSRDPRTPPVDRRGLVLSAAGMSLIVYAVIQAPARGWASPVRIGVLAAGLAALGALVAAERITASPMLDVRLFRNLRFTTTAAAVAIAFFALLGFIFLVTQYFQVVHDYSPLSTGVRLLPVTASVGAASAIGTRLAVPLGNKVTVGAGHPATGPAAGPPLHTADGPDTQALTGTPAPTSTAVADSRQDQRQPALPQMMRCAVWTSPAPPAVTP